MTQLTWNDFFQFETIVINIGLVCFIFHKLEEMGDNSFTKILYNYAKYIYHGKVHNKWHSRYLAPIHWLSENLVYLYYLLLGWGEIFLLFGFMQEVRLRQVQDKSLSLFVGSPLVTVSIFLIIHFYEGKIFAKKGAYDKI